jgi:hypothetical protein
LLVSSLTLLLWIFSTFEKMTLFCRLWTSRNVWKMYK